MEIKLKLNEYSWKLFLNTADMDRDYIDASDYYDFTKIHEALIEQYKLCKEQELEDIDDTVNPKQIDLFEQEEK